MMDCVKSIMLLSDFHDGALNQEEQAQVRAHLALCSPCKGIFRDIDTIVTAASKLRDEQGIAFPDENVLWQRMQIAK